MDIQVLTALALPISIMFFLLGILIGWVARDYMMNYREIPRPHPEMFDINGNLVQELVNEWKASGSHQVKFSGHSIPSGIYFYKMATKGFTDIRKMTLIQ